MKKLFSLVLILCSLTLSGQTVEQGDNLEFIESQKQSEGTDYQQLFEVLTEYKNHPLNLNTADRLKLETLVILNQLQINALVNYREEYGNFTDWQELSRIEGFEPELIEQLKLYCTIGATQVAAKFWTDFKTAGRLEHTIRTSAILKKSAGYQSANNSFFPAFTGNPLKIYTRTRYSLPGKYSLSLLSEKDPGESLFSKTHPVTPDFTTAHLYISPTSRILKQLVIGDYTFSTGSGLAFNPGFGMFKSAQITQVVKPQSGLKPYTSINESNFFRGIACTINIQKLEMTLLLSSKRIDATINQTTGDLGSTYNTGLHRTTAEQKRRKAAIEKVFGVDLRYRLKNWQLGGTVQSSSIQPSNSNIKESRNSVIAVNANHQFARGILFSELASNFTGKPAILCGILSSLSLRVAATIILRNYPINFNSPYGGGFSNSGKLENEKGVFLGIDYLLSTRIKVSGYIDQYKYPAPSFYTKFSASQRDGILQWTYTKKRKLMVYIRGRWQLIQRDGKLEVAAKSYHTIKSNYRLHSEFSLNKVLSLKNRIETTSSFANPAAWLVYQDLVYKPLEKGIHFSGRIAFFRTHGYEDRIYAYENDVLFSYSIPAYFGTGKRYYLMVHGQITRSLDFWVRYSNWIYTNVDFIGSGNDRIPGNKKPQLELQLRLFIK